MARKIKPEKESKNGKRFHPKKSMPRSMWKGSISFGLVNIPVSLYPALKTKDIRFHMLHAKDKSRIEEQIYCVAEHKKISRDEIVKGYEVGAGQHVIVKDEELEALAPKASHTIELIQFTQLKEIDPLYFDRPYYLIPEQTAQKAYALFMQALERSGKVGIAKFIMRKKEYLAALRPIQNVIYLETMHFTNELTFSKDLGEFFTAVKPNDREVKAAEELIDSLTEKFEPQKLHDDYREKVLQLIHEKMEGKEIVATPGEKEHKVEVVDLMAALKASLEEAKKKGKKKSAA